MPTLDGHLLDGKTPVRHPVVVHLSSWGLQWIRKGHAERQLRWSDVIAFQTLGTEQQLELPAEMEEEVNPILLFSREGFRSALSELPEVEQELTSRLGERKHSALRWLLIALITIPAMFVLVLTLAPRAHVFVSVEQEARLGGMLREQMVDVYQRSSEEDREAALQQLVDRLKPAASPYPYRVTLIEEEMVNAFAAPGGEILVFKGANQSGQGVFPVISGNDDGNSFRHKKECRPSRRPCQKERRGWYKK